MGWASTKGRGRIREFLLIMVKVWNGQGRSQRRRNTGSFWRLLE